MGEKHEFQSHYLGVSIVYVSFPIIVGLRQYFGFLDCHLKALPFCVSVSVRVFFVIGT